MGEHGDIVCTNQILNYWLRSSYGSARSRWRDWHVDERSRRPSACDPRDDRSRGIPGRRRRVAGWSSAGPLGPARGVRHPSPGSWTGVRMCRSLDLTRSLVDLRAAGSSGSPVPCWGSAGAAVGAPLRSTRKHLREANRETSLKYDVMLFRIL